MTLATWVSIGVWIYDAHTGKELALLTGHTESVSGVSFSPDGATLASASLHDPDSRGAQSCDALINRGSG